MDTLESPAELLTLDAQRIWHPYAPLPAATPAHLVESATGVRLTLADGRELVDAMSSWWAAIHGYRHPVLDAAVRAQLESMSHVMFGGLTHRPAIALADRLVQISPEGLEHVFFSDSGSVAVEVAIKMALQYWQARGRPERHRLVTWRGGYHGDTFQAMSVCDPDTGMHRLWRDVLPAQLFVDIPPAGADVPVDMAYLEQWDRALAEHSDELAAIIVEPVLQGAGGMRMQHPGYVTALRELADRHDVLLILDEIATGFGRTGALFAADHAGVTPDIMCLGKAMTGGYLSMAATLCTPRIAETISSPTAGAESAALLAHGPTFMGNPLAAAVSLASIDLLLSQDWQATVAGIEAGLRQGLEPLRQTPGVRDVRVLGGVGVVQMDRAVDLAATTAAALGRGVWIRPFGDLLYTMPPYVTGAADIRQICEALSAAAEVPLP